MPSELVIGWRMLRLTAKVIAPTTPKAIRPITPSKPRQPAMARSFFLRKIPAGAADPPGGFASALASSFLIFPACRFWRSSGKSVKARSGCVRIPSGAFPMASATGMALATRGSLGACLAGNDGEAKGAVAMLLGGRLQTVALGRRRGGQRRLGQNGRQFPGHGPGSP